MSSKQVTDRQKTAILVEAALDTHGAAAAQALGETLRSVGDEEAPGVDTRLLLEQLSERLGRVREQLVLADEANVAELGGDHIPRQNRDARAREVYRSISDLKGTLDRVYGPRTSMEVLSLEGTTAQDPVVLHRQAERFVQRCADPETPWPASRYAGLQFNPILAAEELRPKVEALDAALEQVAAERRRAEATLSAKQAAMAEFDKTFQGVANIAKGAFVLADLKDFAGRLRPPRRKPLATTEEGEEPFDEAEASAEGIQVLMPEPPPSDGSPTLTPPIV